MKRLKLLFAVVLSVCIVTACADKPAEKDSRKYSVEEYFSAMNIGLGYSWSEAEDSRILITHNGMYFRRILESIYRLENGEIPHTDGRVPLTFYMDIAEKHFPWDEENVKSALTAGGNYNPKDNTINLTDGLGNVREDYITDIQTEGNIIKITYESGISTYNAETKTYEFLEGDYTTAVMTVKDTGNGYVFLSNENTYSDFFTTKVMQRYVDGLSKALIYQWEETGGELTENPEHLKAAIEGLYGIDMGSYYSFPQTKGRASVDTYITTAGTYLPFDENAVADIIRNDESYSPSTDLVAVSSVTADTAPAQIIKIRTIAKGFEITYKKETGRFTEGALTAKLTPQGYYMFISNRIVK